MSRESIVVAYVIFLFVVFVVGLLFVHRSHLQDLKKKAQRERDLAARKQAMNPLIWGTVVPKTYELPKDTP
jgi:heme exporter protein D